MHAVISHSKEFGGGGAHYKPLDGFNATKTDSNLWLGLAVGLYCTLLHG